MVFKISLCIQLTRDNSDFKLHITTVYLSGTILVPVHKSYFYEERFLFNLWEKFFFALIFHCQRTGTLETFCTNNHGLIT